MLNNKGIAISGILYAALILFMTLMLGILVMATSRKVLLDKEKIDILKELEGSEIISETSGFVCGEDLVDSRDTEEYETVQIGNQCWMAEDLRYECSNFHDVGEEDIDWSGQKDACAPGGYGSMLYQWGAVMDWDGTGEPPEESSQGLCPIGWHIPSDEEWTILTDYVGSSPGTKLKSSEYWNGDDNFGFNALPAGYRNNSGSLNDVGSNGYWWTSSPFGSNAWDRILYSGYSDVGRYDNSQADGRSVRCLLGQ